ILRSDGKRAPSRKASVRLTAPADKPLIEASHVASASDSLRVRLLSIAHARQAAKTASADQEAPKRASPGQLRMMAPATIATIPSAMRRSKFSRNANQARRAVNTLSALSSSDAPDAGIPASPNMSRTG